MAHTGDQRGGGGEVFGNYACMAEGHVWVESTGTDGATEWERINARAGRLAL
jgi:hypothetical protein